MASPEAPRLSLLGLPTEIRLKIYHLCLVQEWEIFLPTTVSYVAAGYENASWAFHMAGSSDVRNRFYGCSRKEAIAQMGAAGESSAGYLMTAQFVAQFGGDENGQDDEASPSPEPLGVSRYFAPQLLCVCKKFRDEGSQILYGKNFFRFYSYRDMARFTLGVGSSNAGRIQNIQIPFPNLSVSDDWTDGEEEEEDEDEDEGEDEDEDEDYPFISCLRLLWKDYTNLRMVRMEILSGDEACFRIGRRQWVTSSSDSVPLEQDGHFQDFSSSMTGQSFSKLQQVMAGLSSSPEITVLLCPQLDSDIGLREESESYGWAIIHKN